MSDARGLAATAKGNRIKAAMAMALQPEVQAAWRQQEAMNALRTEMCTVREQMYQSMGRNQDQRLDVGWTMTYVVVAAAAIVLFGFIIVVLLR